jgi:hypothetical protein
MVDSLSPMPRRRILDAAEPPRASAREGPPKSWSVDVERFTPQISKMQNTSTFRQETFPANRAAQAQVEVRRSGVSRLRAAKALFLGAACVSFLFSVYLWFLVEREQGLFVGLWVPSILALGALLLSGKGEAR